jgi:PAS domain S-box-containing protein
VLYGWSSEEALGKVSHSLLQTEFPFSMTEEQLTEELYRNGRWTGELGHTTRDGKRITVLVRKTLDHDSDGKPTAVLQTLTDISARKQAQEKLREAKEAAEAANRSKDRFLAVLSHELRTPLTPVLMAVAALEHDPELRRDVREDMVMIKRNIELEVKFIDDLLDVSRIGSGKVPLHIAPLDLNGAVREVCARLRSQLLEQRVRLELELSGDIGLIAADAVRLQQVLSNVLRNAVKFTPEQGAIRVTSARLGSGRCEVRVCDSGIGIPAGVLPHIFDAFEQGDARVTRQFGGLGLGLTIAKALVELHGGSIRAESAGSGQGATFIIELPGEHSAVAAAAPPAVPEGEVPGRLRLLIVEDHDDTARALSRLLTKAGYEVSIAGDVATALALAGREPFDLLISDLGLPDGTGHDVMTGLQKIQPLPGIAMSGYGMDEDVSKSRESGFCEHLVKPIEVPKLIAAIRRVMEPKP